MRLLLLALMIATPSLAEVEFGASQGRFPVFGPSAEREAFFAEQAAAEAARIAQDRQAAEARRLQALRTREAEARAEAAEAEARASRSDGLCREVLPLPKAESVQAIGPRPRSRRIVCYDGTDFVTLPLPVRRRLVDRTGIFISVDDGDVSGGVVIQRPGFGFGLSVR